MGLENRLSVAVRNPKKATRWAWTRYNRDIRGRTGIDVPAADWDNLVVLDACRYDLFEEFHSFPGHLSSVISRGSNTVEWLQKNFPEDEYGDIVYVTANGNLSYLNAKFCDRVRLMDPEYGEDCWDDERKIVPPSAVVDTALDALSTYPNKRLIVHFLQPHQPFVGPTGRQLYDEGRLEYDQNGTNFWQQIKQGRVDERRVQKAYRENFEYVVPYVNQLLDGLRGKTIITSDHGNAFGRFGVYGHPHDTYLEGLVRVPWLEIEDDRRTITDGQATAGSVGRTKEVESRLEDLGYV